MVDDSFQITHDEAEIDLMQMVTIFPYDVFHFIFFVLIQEAFVTDVHVWVGDEVFVGED
jgi:hypothetical protein